MRVAVIGAGVTGITSAYYLSASGHDVTVIDAAKEVAAETSFANGGQLSYSHVDALARPSFVPGIPGLLAGQDPAIQVRLFSRPAMLGWGLHFLRQCTAARARENTIAVLKLAMQSARKLAEIRATTGIAFDFATGGKLVLLPQGANLKDVKRSIELKKKYGTESTLMPMQEAVDLEPALAAFTQSYAGAIYSAGDEVGDARLFSLRLAEWLQKERNVKLRLGTRIRSIVASPGEAVALKTNAGMDTTDCVVVSAGCGSRDLLAPLGVTARIYPVRGYSITLPRGDQAPVISITDLAQKIVYCPLGNRLRIAGFADFTGRQHGADSRRIATLQSMASAAAPEIAGFNAGDQSPWAGSRPMTPDGRPLVGATGVAGVFMNCGHGALGWTLAAATASELADTVAASADRQ